MNLCEESESLPPHLLASETRQDYLLALPVVQQTRCSSPVHVSLVVSGPDSALGHHGSLKLHTLTHIQSRTYRHIDADTHLLFLPLSLFLFLNSQMHMHLYRCAS